MREGKIEDILVLTEEEENTPLFVTPRARRDVQVKKSSYQGKIHSNEIFCKSTVSLVISSFTSSASLRVKYQAKNC